MGRTQRGWLCALGLLGCLTAQAASPVWAIRGAHNTVYLAGSVHLLARSDAALPDGFERAYSHSRVLMMELDLGKAGALDAATWMLAHGRLPQGTRLEELLGALRYQRLQQAAARLGLPLETFANFAPWVLGLELLELQYARIGLDPDQGVEQQLNRRAAAEGKTTAGLETLPEQLGLFAALPLTEQVRLLDMVLDELPAVDSEMQAVVGAWRNGDARKLGALLAEEYRAFPALYRTLVSDRNHRWLPRIEQLLCERDDYFVVVGALHLVGDEGLLELARKDGYRAEQLD